MYLDPGFGGMLVQIIVVIAAVGGGVIFSLRKKISNLFSKNKSGPTSDIKHTITDDDTVDMLDDDTN
ncbi:MAG: hypothetical protein FWC13_00590 [Oscillospiraceae bacterium]|nr:hypothetical protein [Oscillospiraceae bacterium]